METLGRPPRPKNAEYYLVSAHRSSGRHSSSTRCSAPTIKSPYTQTGERIARLAASGIRLLVGDLRTDVTKTRKDGSRGRLRIDYGDARDPQVAVAWLWTFIDGAKTAGELYGRALVVIAAEQYATRGAGLLPARGADALRDLSDPPRLFWTRAVLGSAVELCHHSAAAMSPGSRWPRRLPAHDLAASR